MDKTTRQVLVQESSAWQPSGSTRLTLKQLGISTHFWQTQIDSYCDASDTPNDADFLIWLGSLAPERKTSIKVSQLLVNLNWKPSKNSIENLTGEGYKEDQIAFYVDVFIMAMRESQSIHQNWNLAFEKYIRGELRLCKTESNEDDTSLLLKGFNRQDIARARQVFLQLGENTSTSFEQFFLNWHASTS